jgi:hypothetical protein
MLKRTLFAALVATGTLAFTASAQAAYLTLGTTNTSNATTALSGNSTGSEFLVKNTNGSSASAFGLYALLTATSPTVNATAVRGQNSSTNGKGYGVYGSQAGSGTGVRGFAPGGNGIWGSSTSGTGVRGSSSSGYGVNGTGKFGVVGTGSDTGVWASSGNASGSGVYGQNTSSGVGVQGTTQSGRGVAGFSDSWQGVYGHSNSNAGVVGESTNFDGVYGQAHTSTTAGVSGHNDAGGYGVWAGTSDGIAIYGTSASSGVGIYGTSPDSGVEGVGQEYGVIGDGGGTGYIAVHGAGASFGGTFEGSSTGVVGSSNSGYGGFFTGTTDAGYFNGNVKIINGSCTGCAGPSALQIDDPLDPAHKYLNHASVVSSQQLDVYSGNVTTNAKGFATVRMPRWFQALNRSFRYQLTVVGKTHWDAKAAVWNEIKSNRFTIRTDQPKVKVSWLVTAVRHDRSATAHPTRVIVRKSKTDQGKYVDPRVYGKPRSDGIGYQKPPRAPRTTIHNR